MILKHWLGAVLAFCLLSSCTSNELTEEEVATVIHRFDNAWLKKNKETVDSVLAPEYIYFTRSGNLFSRDGVVQTAGSPDYVLDSMKRSNITVQLHGNTAIVSTTWYGKGTYLNEPFDELQRCSMVILKEDGKVQIASEHCGPVIQTKRYY